VKTTVQLSGFKELDAALGELPKATGYNVLRRVLVKAGEPLAAGMRDRAPKEQGDLAEGITVSTARPKAKKRTKKTSAVEVVIGPGQHPQGSLQEHGTVNHSPHPFVRPAWDEGRAEALDTIGQELGGEIEKAAKRLAKRRARAAKKG
jgi:HK97 gp10 family phage protein